jgi:FAD:protein FMN transferase
MSTWTPDSDLMRLNRAAVGDLVRVPPELARVLALGLEIGRASDGMFDIGLGDAVSAWGFGPRTADPQDIRAAMAVPRRPAHEVLEINGNLVRKQERIVLDLNGIAKGHGVDRLAEVIQGFGIESALVGIDGEMRAIGLRPDEEAWTIAVEQPDPDLRKPHSILALHNAAVATSGDYRHWVTVGDSRFSHTMDPRRGVPLASSPASVTVVGPICAEADAWATALMVAGPVAGTVLATRHGLDVLFLIRDNDDSVHTRAVGRLFGGQVAGS